MTIEEIHAVPDETIRKRLEVLYHALELARARRMTILALDFDSGYMAVQQVRIMQLPEAV